MSRASKTATVIVVGAIALVVFFFTGVSEASAHGWRHGKNLSASEIKQRPSWMMMPGHTCNRDFQGDIAVTYDEELGWIIIWKCTCTRHPNGITYICWWRPMRVLPENVTNRRILREIREVMAGRDYTRPRFRELPGGYVVRKHSRYNDCHWHNPKPKMVIWATRLG